MQRSEARNRKKIIIDVKYVIFRQIPGFSFKWSFITKKIETTIAEDEDMPRLFRTYNETEFFLIEKKKKYVVVWRREYLHI